MRHISKTRSAWIMIIFLLLYLILLINLYFIQILQTDFFNTLANRQYHIELVRDPMRGEILDRNGQAIALNKESLSAFILPRQLQNEAELKNFLNEHFPLAAQRLSKSADKHFMYIARRLTDDFCNKIKNEKLIDIKLIKEPSRFYVNESMAQLIGITNIDNHGIFGLEQQYDALLAGSAVRLSLEKDARSSNFYFNRDQQLAGKNGSDLYLTIDSDLQFLTYEALAEAVHRLDAELGAVVIMNPNDGQIVTLASYPGFNPNDTQELVQENTRLVPVVDSYEYGSIMKPFVALAAFAENLVTADELNDCENKTEAYVDGMRFTTTRASVGSHMPFSEVVARSNNIGMVKVAKRLGTKLYDHYTQLGFGSKTGINFMGEQSGYVSHPARWSKRSIISLSFGYEITATLLQVARAFCVIANGGNLLHPKLILNEVTPDPIRIYDQKSVLAVQDILRQTVQHGTGVRAKIRGYDIMGKTGTANLAIDGSYSQKHLIFSFAGIVQKGDYNRVIVVCLKDIKSDRQMYGSNTAAPLFEKIAEQMLVHGSLRGL